MGEVWQPSLMEETSFQLFTRREQIIVFNYVIHLR